MPFETPFEVSVGLRYTAFRKSGGGNRFISFTTLTSMLGLAFGVVALIVVLSVMNGFQKKLRTRILGVASHAQISGAAGELEDRPAAVVAFNIVSTLLMMVPASVPTLPSCVPWATILEAIEALATDIADSMHA